MNQPLTLNPIQNVRKKKSGDKVSEHNKLGGKYSEKLKKNPVAKKFETKNYSWVTPIFVCDSTQSMQ